MPRQDCTRLPLTYCTPDVARYPTLIVRSARRATSSADATLAPVACERAEQTAGDATDGVTAGDALVQALRTPDRCASADSAIGMRGGTHTLAPTA